MDDLAEDVRTVHARINPRSLGLREKNGPAFRAVTFGFLPTDRADRGGAGFGRTRPHNFAADATGLRLLWHDTALCGQGLVPQCSGRPPDRSEPRVSPCPRTGLPEASPRGHRPSGGNVLRLPESDSPGRRRRRPNRCGEPPLTAPSHYDSMREDVSNHQCRATAFLLQSLSCAPESALDLSDLLFSGRGRYTQGLPR